MITASTKLSSLSKYKIRKISKIVLSFCGETFGKLKNRSYPKFILSFKTDTKLMGEYYGIDNSITIYVKYCETVSDLTSTIIHEWTHSKQKIVGQYYKLLLRYGYDNHPMEIEARSNEKKWNRKSLNYVKKRIKD